MAGLLSPGMSGRFPGFSRTWSLTSRSTERSRWRRMPLPGPRRNRVTSLAPSVEQLQVDRVSHRAVAPIARVQVVAAVVDRQHLRRMPGVAQGQVEVGEAVEEVGLPQPLVDGQ